MKNRSFKGIGFYIIVLIILIGTIAIMYGSNDKNNYVYSEILDYIENEDVRELVLDGNTLNLKLKDNTILRYDLADVDRFYDDAWELIRQQYDAGIIT